MTHTYRTRPTPNANPELQHKNKLLAGKEDYATALEEQLNQYDEAGNKIRGNAVLAIEYLLSASPEFFEQGSKLERDRRLQAWCDNQVAFMKEKHGAENILNMYLHLDEKTPHIECFVVPIDSKGKLNCRYYLGGPKKLALLQTEYATYNKEFGLSRGAAGSPATHQTVKQFYDLINTKSKITNADVVKALEFDKPTMLDKLNVEKFLKEQLEKITKNVNKLFGSTVYESKLIPMAKKIIKDHEKMKKLADTEKRRLEEDLAIMKEQLIVQAKLHNLVDYYKEEVEKLEEVNNQLNSKLKKYETKAGAKNEI